MKINLSRVRTMNSTEWHVVAMKLIYGFVNCTLRKSKEDEEEEEKEEEEEEEARKILIKINV